MNIQEAIERQMQENSNIAIMERYENILTLTRKIRTKHGREDIWADATDVLIRSEWHEIDATPTPCEYSIFLTEERDIRIVGILDKNRPTDARLQYKKLGQWHDAKHDLYDEKVLLRYAKCFYFG